MTRPAALEDPGWQHRAWERLLHLANTGEPFTADALHTPDIGDPDQPNDVGNLIKEAARSGLITFTDRVTRSTRGPRKGSILRIWTGTTPRVQGDAA